MLILRVKQEDERKEFTFLLPEVFSFLFLFYFFSQCIQNLKCALYTGKYAKLSETIQWLLVTRGQPGSF